MSFPAPASDLSDSTGSEQHESLEELLFPVGMKNRDLLRRSIHADFFLEIGAEIAGKSEEDIHLCFDRYIPQLNLEFANWLNDWGQIRLAKGKRNPQIEGILVALNATWNFPRGNRAGKLEIFLICNQLQLLTINRDNDPQLWAHLQHSLAMAYSDRVKGDRAENLETAIVYCNSALKVRNKNDLPLDWAKTQNNLAITYGERIRGNRAENLEIAINYYNSLLEIYTKDGLSIEWARTQNNLAIIYCDRIRGDRAENLEVAIACYNSALEIYTQDALPSYWAMTQNNLATAYDERVRGDRAENLEISIACYNSALEIYTKKDFPIDWAMTQHNLGKAYSDRIRGDRAENLEMAIKCCKSALETKTKNDSPIDWACTQNILANIYGDRIQGDRADNLEIAIVCYKSALEIRTYHDLPIAWATTQNNLAYTYSDRIQGDRADNLEIAIACYKSALEIRTKDYLPIDWATTQNNLAHVYRLRINGDQSENLEKAIECYENALPITVSSGFFQELDKIKNCLADAYIQRINFCNIDVKSFNQTNDSLQQLVHTCLKQTDWYKASLSLDLCSKALVSQQKPAEAVQPLLQAIGLDIQHNPQLIDTDLQELAKLISQLDWQPSELMSKWQAASEAFSVSMPPLNSALQAQICLTIGVVSIQEKYWFKGLDWLKASWEIYQSTDDLRGLAEVSYQLAIGHHIASNLSYAGIYYRDAQRIFQHLEDARKVAFCHHGLGRLLLQMGKIKPATAEFDRALAIYHTIPDSAQVADKISDIQYYQRIITNMQDPNRTHQLI